METCHIDETEVTQNFDTALRRATQVAGERLGENMLVSWYDRERDLESPAHASEYHEGREVKGFWDYALNHGATLTVVFDAGRFVFCFRPLKDPA